MFSLLAPAPTALSADPAREGEAVGAIAELIPPMSRDATCGAAFERFREDPDLVALPIVDGVRPIGLINRHDIMMLWSSQFGRSLFTQKSVMRIMDAAPLVVDADLHIDELQSLIVDEKPSALMRGFILARDGHYAGIGSALALLRFNVQRTERRNRELDRAREAAEQASRSKTAFLANMSHELRTPLNAIIGFSELIQQQVYGPLRPARYVDYIGDIHASGNHLLMIINDILDMAKIEAGRMELHEEEVDLEAVMRSVLRFFAARAEQDGLVLRLVCDTGLPRLLADQRAIRQILLNLLSNAIKFTSGGGVIIVRAGRLTSGEIELAVADSGIGIDPEHIEAVLAPFGQIAHEHNRSHDGTGLGLPLVRAFAELHGASFSIDSAVGRGTTVMVRFPAHRALEPPTFAIPAEPVRSMP
jgi:two-component system cell cycle sensor histidine kinase PleC